MRKLPGLLPKFVNSCSRLGRAGLGAVLPDLALRRVSKSSRSVRSRDSEVARLAFGVLLRCSKLC